jgi:hypothetical protein
VNARLAIPVAVIAVIVAFALVALLAAEGFSAAVAIPVVVLALVGFIILGGFVR